MSVVVPRFFYEKTIYNKKKVKAYNTIWSSAMCIYYHKVRYYHFYLYVKFFFINLDLYITNVLQ